jgi:diaminopimelate decarboxylase
LLNISICDPALDEAFPEGSEIRLIAEPGRYLVAASSTLLVNVVAVRSNIVDDKEDELKPISNEEASRALATMTRAEEDEVVNDQGIAEHEWSQAIMDEMSSYAQLFTRQSLAQQEVDTYSHRRDFSMSGGDMTANFLAPPEEWPQDVEQHHTAEGVNSGIVADCLADDDVGAGLMTLAAAGEAAVAGVVIQSVADATTNNDDFSYYVTDGVYGAFNNIMFDHAVVRPRLLHHSSLSTPKGRTRSVSLSDIEGFQTLEYDAEASSSDDDSQEDLYTSTIFGPTCDSIDVISRSVLLPKLSIGDWLYFNNMGAYTMAAASSFNGFTPTEKFYVCSVQPEYFEKLLAGPVPEEK